MHRLQPSASVHGGAPCVRVRVRVRVRNAALVVADMATCGYPPPLMWFPRSGHALQWLGCCLFVPVECICATRAVLLDDL
jgi:hypothetical protein